VELQRDITHNDVSGCSRKNNNFIIIEVLLFNTIIYVLLFITIFIYFLLLLIISIYLSFAFCWFMITIYLLFTSCYYLFLLFINYYLNIIYIHFSFIYYYLWFHGCLQLFSDNNKWIAHNNDDNVLLFTIFIHSVLVLFIIVIIMFNIIYGATRWATHLSGLGENEDSGLFLSY
jgi:hypothetical protein